MKRYTAVSAFTGIAGMDIAFFYAGFEIIAQIENNEFCRKVIRHHANRYWPRATLFTDVRKCGHHNLPYRPDVFMAGFPCQPHSVAGSRKGADDSRNLWPDTRRIIGEIRPRVVFLENVPGIVTTIATGVIADLAALGYVGRAGVVSATDAGAAHIRERWWVVAYANNYGRQRSFSTEANTYHEKQYNSSLERRGSAKQRSTVSNGSISHEATMGNATISRLAQGVRTNIQTNIKETHSRLVTQPQRPDGRLPQPALGMPTDGVPDWLARHRRPAAQSEEPYGWEAPRTVEAKGTDYKEKIRALGNAVFPPTVFPFAVAIREALDAMARS